MEGFYALNSRHGAEVLEILLAKQLKTLGEYVKMKKMQGQKAKTKFFCTKTKEAFFAHLLPGD